MGTRADFYVGRGEHAEWLGSIGWDGYPSGIRPSLLTATTREEFLSELYLFFQGREDVTTPERGWPWPWDDSQTTDYAYALDDGRVWGSCFGGEWFLAADGEPDDEDENDDSYQKVAVFPNMASRRDVAWDKRSGLIILGGAE